jgi:hypothetical protein
MESSDDDDWLIPVLVATVLSAQGKQRLQSNRCTTGQEWVDDVLNCGNDKRIRNQLRMQLNTFSSLRDWLCINTTLHSSRWVSIEEKLFIFIWITSSRLSNRSAQERFNRSPSVISR